MYEVYSMVTVDSWNYNHMTQSARVLRQLGLRLRTGRSCFVISHLPLGSTREVGRRGGMRLGSGFLGSG